MVLAGVQLDSPNRPRRVTVGADAARGWTAVERAPLIAGKFAGTGTADQ